MSYKYFLNFIFLGLLAFIIDLITPLGSSMWSLYIILLVFYIKQARNYRIFDLTSFYIILLILGYLLSPKGVLPYIPEINWIASLATMMLVAYLGFREGKTTRFNSEILDRISDGLFAIDKKWKITYISASLMKYAKIEHPPEGKGVWEVFPEMQGTVFEKKFIKAMNRQKPVSFQSDNIYPEIKFQVYAYPSKEGLTIFGKDITYVKNKEKELQILLEQKEMLIKEVHHRVKNNFQLISSLIRLSTKDVTDEKMNMIITDIEARIKTLSLIHEKLYKSSTETHIDLKSYLEELFHQLSSVSKNPFQIIHHNIVIEDVDINIDSAISIGLIVNELYSNSLKHAFKHVQNGEVGLKICIFKDDRSKLQLIYRDNGSGFNGKSKALNNGSLGLAIIHSYVQQSKGSIDITDDKEGLQFDIILRIQK